MSITNFLATLPTIGMGLVGVFAVAVVSIVVVNILNKVTAPKQ